MTTPILVLDAGHGLKTPGKQTLNGNTESLKSGNLTIRSYFLSWSI